MNNVNNIKGITLVSLVITIVIMLILVGVSISFIIGNNGLFGKSKNSAELYKNASAKEMDDINSCADDLTSLTNAVTGGEDNKPNLYPNPYNLFEKSQIKLSYNNACTARKNDDGSYYINTANYYGSAGLQMELPEKYNEHYTKLCVEVSNVICNTSFYSIGLWPYSGDDANPYGDTIYRNSMQASENVNPEHITQETYGYKIDISDLHDKIGDNRSVFFMFLNGISGDITNMWLE